MQLYRHGFPRWWNWRVSAQWRLGSLLSAWALVGVAGLVGPLFWPLAAVRTVFSLTQTWLNVRLGRVSPVAPATLQDRVLLALIIAGAYVGAGVGRITGDLTSPWLLLPMLAPFTLLQVRMAGRAFEAAREGREPGTGWAPTSLPMGQSEAPRKAA